MLEPENTAGTDLTEEEEAALDREWEERLQRLAVEASAAAKQPRRFTICDDYPRTNDEIVYAWGWAFDNEAVIYRPARHGKHGHARITDCPERTLRLYSRIIDARLIWMDPEPAASGSAS